jgi:single-strand DNA-binding protein
MAINMVCLSGNLTKDPSLSRTQSGSAVLNMGLAVNNRRKNNQGEWVDDPAFVDLVMFGSRAESVSNYLSKGSKIAIVGRLRWNQWERDGQKRSKLDVIVDEIEFMSKGQQTQGGGYDSYHDNVRKQQAEYVQATYYDDDCPF